MHAKLAATVLGAVIVVIVLVAAAVSGTVSTYLDGTGSTNTSQPSRAALDDIPSHYLALYRQAATSCPGLDWSILAAVGKIETDHGRSTLPGVHKGENEAHAGGPMQFLRSTFDSVVARHPIPPGGSNPPSRYNPHDAIHAAGFYICDALGTDGELRRALFAYNHSDDYVDAVLAQADTYRAAPAAHPGDIRLDWPPEQATVPDPTTSGRERITPRTHAVVRALQQRGLTGDGIVCFGRRPNPHSDHPQGRACDIFVDPHNPASVAEGWRIASWLIEHQARYATAYLIYQGRYWSASDPRWTTYRSTVYGCPNNANLTGCHYDHVHVSVF
ncbi:lytic transglycosylase domain-containing protein [Haloechinothrix salitolerans]|uniref:Lytic transglycosylase domain-containing protein n=1 Tax=Haloechinothrix salitolerans TaxID=926830 RepID=A0ABW2BWK6_9PSEU